MKKREPAASSLQTVLFSVIALGLMGSLQAASEAAASRVAAMTPKGVSASDWTSILGLHERAQRHIELQGSGVYTTRNSGQQWQVSFDEKGFLAQPNESGWKWGLELRGYGYGAEGNILSAKKASATAEKNRLVYRRDHVLSEWYVNRSEGLLQGWTLANRPSENTQGKPLELTLGVRGGLRPQLAGEGAVAFTDSKGTAVLNYSGLKAWDADGKSLGTRFAVLGRDVVIRVDDRDARYPVTIDPIAQQAYLKASNTDAGDSFGSSVAVSGDTMVIGAPREDSASIGVDGNQVDNNKDASGAAYVFVRNGGVWSQQAYLKASNTDTTDCFGVSVAISGDTIVVGAGEDSSATGIGGNQADNTKVNSGAAYVFVRSAGVWLQQAYLKASNTDINDNFGSLVAVSGDTIVVGAYGEDSNATGVDGNQADNSKGSSGAAYVFVRSAGVWSQQAYLKASNTDASDNFGVSVAVSGNTIVVGAYEEDSNATGVDGNQADNNKSASGAAYVFVRNGGVWSQQAYLKASNTDIDDNFGSLVAVSGDTIVVGAYGEDSNATGVDGNQADNSKGSSGAAYVFVRSAGVWSQQAYLKASNTDAGYVFGFSMAVLEDTIVVGAIGENSNATGVDGNQADNSKANSGAAYVFVRNAGVWSQQAYLKASNTDASDNFSVSVAVSGDTIVVGASGESSNATGVGGNQADNNQSNSGAAYVFDLFTQPPAFAPPPTIMAKGKKKYMTSLTRVKLRGTSTNATQIVFKVKGRPFKPAKGSAASWKTSSFLLNPGRNTIKVRASGPGGTSAILKFIVTHTVF